MPRHRDRDLLASVGRRIAQARARHGLTQQQLAEATGVEPETMSRAESGSIALSLGNLARVARALDLSLADLVDDNRPLPEPDRPEGEAALVALYRALDSRGRRAVLAVARELARTP